MKCFFKSSEKTVSIPENNFFSQNLPAKLYLFLDDHDLLDEEQHSYSFRAESGSAASATIIVETNARARNVSVSIRVEKKQDGKYFHDLYIFNDQIWFLSMSDEWFNAVRGNSKATSLGSDMLTDKQCVKKTPKEVDFIIDRLGKIIAPEPVPVKRRVLFI